MIDNIELITVFEDFPVGSVLLNEKGEIIFANNKFLDIFSFTQEQLQGKSAWSILSLPSKEKHADFHSLFNKEPSPRKQIEIKDKQGKIYLIDFKAYTPINDGDKFYVGFLIDNKEEKNLKKELQKQISLKDTILDDLEQENELSEMKSRFLSIASHEFRTPLSGILSSLNLIERYLKADQETWTHFKNREKVANHLSKINESVKNLTTILTKFLALGNIEKGEIPVRMTTFNLEGALKTQVSQFQEICKPGQKITYCHKGKEVSAYLDKYLLKNIMNNLLSNAIKFSYENSIIKLHTEINSKKIYIELKDEGIGIPEVEQNKIFRRFFRAKNALAFQEGTGLGLNIVKKYVELMKGNITYESKENEGTSFYITFPNRNK